MIEGIGKDGCQVFRGVEVGKETCGMRHNFFMVPEFISSVIFQKKDVIPSPSVDGGDMNEASVGVTTGEPINSTLGRPKFFLLF